MDFRVTFSENSLTELRAIISYIAEDNPAAAEALGARFMQIALGLSRFYPRSQVALGNVFLFPRNSISR
jgi:plasmid stabilization system protein ParE